jgi:predicted transport protein
LRRLENHDRKERASIDEYTIEHIMPQSLSTEWKTSLGDDWQRIHQTYLHTLGNLTLTAYNSEYSNKPFLVKRDMKGGFKESPLKLNQGLGLIDRWDEAAICHRADRLSTLALAVWIAPFIDPLGLESYKSQPIKAGYTIDDYTHLSAGTTRDLFEALRKEILALDSCVTEEFLKYYIAYKAETNFVDIEPQSKRLRISLNMPFSEINDPRGICKDVSTVGRRGNGDVEIGLASIDELPYVMGLVRQALERQMENS